MSVRKRGRNNSYAGFQWLLDLNMKVRVLTMKNNKEVLKNLGVADGHVAFTGKGIINGVREQPVVTIGTQSGEYLLSLSDVYQHDLCHPSFMAAIVGKKTYLQQSSKC
jgi:hypothetical protein